MLARSFENASPFFVSSGLKRVFSRRITSPSCIASTAAFAFGPTTSGSAANFTSCPRSSERRAATGASVFVSLSSSVLTFPRCEQRITLPPSAINFLIVGSAATSLFSSVIFPSFNGTLKSHLQRTRSPLTLISSTDFLFNDIFKFLLTIMFIEKEVRSKKTGPLLRSYKYLFANYYANSAKYLIVLTIWLVYEFSLSYHETT